MLILKQCVKSTVFLGYNDYQICVSRFGGKEEFMTFMNRFIEKEATNMKSFLRKISVSRVYVCVCVLLATNL